MPQGVYGLGGTSPDSLIAQSVGDASSYPRVRVNSQGWITAVGSVPLTPPPRPTSYGELAGLPTPPSRFGSFTQGSVIFAGSGGVLSQDNANFFWDASNVRLGIGRNTVTYTVDILKNSNATVGYRSENTNNGASAFTEYMLKNDTADTMRMSLTSSTSTDAGVTQAGFIEVNGRPLHFITVTNQPMDWFPNNLRKMRLLGSGHLLINNVNDFANLHITQEVLGSTLPGFRLTAGAHAGLAVSETIDTYFNLARTVNFTAGGGTIAVERVIVIEAPTYTATTNPITITRAGTLTVEGPPVASTNVTIGNPFSFWVRTGASYFQNISIGDNTYFPASFWSITIDRSTVSIALNRNTDATDQKLWFVTLDTTGEFSIGIENDAQSIIQKSLTMLRSGTVMVRNRFPHGTVMVDDLCQVQNTLNASMTIYAGFSAIMVYVYEIASGVTLTHEAGSYFEIT